MNRIAVIGSGFSSLAAASVLASNGCRVTVYEKNKTLGGRARTFSADGFTFDMGPSWYWMPDVFASYFALFGKKISDYYELKLLDPSYCVFFEDNNVLQVPAAPDALYGLFDSIEKNGGLRLKKFLREAAYKYEVGMQNLVFKPGQSFAEFLNRDFLKGVFKMHVLQSFHRYVRKYFKDPRLIRIMEFPVLFLGGMPRNTPALYSLMNYAGLSLGTWYPMGGMGKVIDAMVTLARALGVVFQTDVEISKIAVRDKVACGVHCNDQFFAADAVVAGADYQHVEQNLLSPDHRTYNHKYWNSRVMAPSSLIFYLGVNKKIDNLQHHNLFFDEDFDSHIQDIYGQPRWPSKPLFYVCCPSKTDPTVAPKGSENLFILIPIAAGLNDDEETRHKYFELVITRLEKSIRQRFKDNIVFQRSYCLRDFKNDYHAFKGNAYGLANTLKQTAVFKPSMRSKKVENLFFSGQLTVPGPGVPPSLISGQVAARQALIYLNGN